VWSTNGGTSQPGTGARDGGWVQMKDLFQTGMAAGQVMME